MKTFKTLKGVFGSGARVFVIERVKSGATPMLPMNICTWR